ncbi:ribosome biogenesis GTPase A [Clostridium sp. CAG:710]|nr:ribosome biogenesis GTPase A [Clostridium sp. CAG:710]
MDMYQKRKIRAEKKNNDSQKSFSKVPISWYPGHMAKTKREIKEKLPLIDVVYEVVDARMPISSKVIDIDDIIKNKPRILIMTKYDMCDKSQTDKIIKYYKEKGYNVVPVDLIKNTNVNLIIKETSKVSDIINVERKKKGLKPKQSVRALVIGAPNVGKSTLINRLVGKKKTVTGNKPGVTKQLSWIRVGSNIELLDTPGILWPKLENQEHAYNLAALSSVKEEVVDLQDLSIYILHKLNELYPNYLEKRYGITTVSDDIIATLEEIGNRRGAKISGGEIDYDKVYSIIIRDLKEGLIGPVTLDRL